MSDDTSVDEEVLDDFSLDDKTPVTDPCPVCGMGPMLRLADWIHQPRSRDEVWKMWPGMCVSTQSGEWRWCPKKEIFKGNVEVHWPDRRKKR